MPNKGMFIYIARFQTKRPFKLLYIKEKQVTGIITWSIKTKSKNVSVKVLKIHKRIWCISNPFREVLAALTGRVTE